MSCVLLLGDILPYFGTYFGVWSSISSEPFNIFSWKFLQVFKNFMAPFYGSVLTLSRLQMHYEEVVYFLSLSLQKVLVLDYPDGFSITLAVTTQINFFSLNPLNFSHSARGHFHVFLSPCVFVYVPLCLKKLSIFWSYIFTGNFSH